MSDIKLFHITDGKVNELEAQSYTVEKSLQALIERHAEAFLGVRFLASEYSTGRTHGGRIDTLGLDENNSPVIIEYKRSLNENVINQGLFYLDWLMDHKADFVLLVQRKLGPEVAESIEWGSPRLLCIANNFTRYDGHAVQQINRNIELLLYKRYGEGLLLLELVNTTTGQVDEVSDSLAVTKPTKTKVGRADPTAQLLYEMADTELRDRFETLKAFLLALGDDVQFKTLKYYFAFKRLKNFACVEVHPQTRELLAYIKVDPDSVVLEPGFTRDVRKIGHFGTGSLEIRLRSTQDLEKAKDLLARSYEAS